MPENYIKLLSHLQLSDDWSDRDRENFEAYLGQWDEYTTVLAQIKKLTEIRDTLPETDETFAGKLGYEIGRLESLKGTLRYRVLFIANALANSALESDERLSQAAEYFLCHEVWSALIYTQHYGRSIESLEENIDEEFDENVQREADLDNFLTVIADELFEIGFEAAKTPAGINSPDTELYIRASIKARAYMQNRFSLGLLLYRKGKYLDAIEEFRAVDEELGETMNLPDRLSVLDILGELEVDNGLYEQARGTLFSTVEICRKLLPDDPDAYRPRLATFLTWLGWTLFRLEEDDAAAKEYLVEAFDINRRLMKTDPEKFESQVMEGLGYLAQFHVRDRDFDTVERCFLQAVKLARKLSEEKKYYLSRLGFFLSGLAVVHEEMLNIDAAEREHDEAWKLFHDLADEDPKRYIVDLAHRSLLRARFLQKFIHEKKEKSIWDAADAFVLACGFVDDEIAVSIAFEAKEILEKWELDPGEIGHRLSFQEAVRGTLIKNAKNEA